MGKKLDALLGRNFKPSKFKPTVDLAISRLTVLNNQHHARLNLARSDVVKLLQLGHHERALLRVEHVIKEQNLLDVYDKIEGYCNLLIERVHLIEQERECPEELKEAASGLIYASSRRGDLPEILEIRAILTSRFGKEFAARAIELRNNCEVDRQMIQKLSTRMPGLESRMKVLKEIASENGISLQFEQVSYVTNEEHVHANVKKQNQQEPEIREEENIHDLSSKGKDEDLPDSCMAKKKYKDVADAAQAAFESAANAAAAARAALELSRLDPRDSDDHISPSSQPRKVLDRHDSVEVVSQLEGKEILSERREEPNQNAEELEKPEKFCSSYSDDEILKGGSVLSLDAEIEGNPFGKELVFDESDGEAADKQKDNNHSSMQISSEYDVDIEVASNEGQESKMKSAAPPHLYSKKKPFSVRTRRVH